MRGNLAGDVGNPAVVPHLAEAPFEMKQSPFFFGRGKVELQTLAEDDRQGWSPTPMPTVVAPL